MKNKTLLITFITVVVATIVLLTSWFLTRSIIDNNEPVTVPISTSSGSAGITDEEAPYSLEDEINIPSSTSSGSAGIVSEQGTSVFDFIKTFTNVEANENKVNTTIQDNTTYFVK